MNQSKLKSEPVKSQLGPDDGSYVARERLPHSFNIYKHKSLN